MCLKVQRIKHISFKLKINKKEIMIIIRLRLKQIETHLKKKW